jgi:hypothetical protein
MDRATDTKARTRCNGGGCADGGGAPDGCGNGEAGRRPEHPNHPHPSTSIHIHPSMQIPLGSSRPPGLARDNEGER